MSLLAELTQFVAQHRACGALTGDAEDPGPYGYRLWVSCPCGAAWARWVTPEDADHELIHTETLAETWRN